VRRLFVFFWVCVGLTCNTPSPPTSPLPPNTNIRTEMPLGGGPLGAGGGATAVTVSANEGLSGNGLSSAPLELIQTCSNNQVLAYNTGTNQWGCTTPTTGTVTGVVSNQGLADTGNQLELIQSCSNNQVLSYNTSTSQWGCSTPTTGTVTGVVSNEGLADTGNQLELIQSCLNGQHLTYNTSTSQWGCSTVTDNGTTATLGPDITCTEATGACTFGGLQTLSDGVSSTTGPNTFGGVTTFNNGPKGVNNYAGTHFEWASDWLGGTSSIAASTLGMQDAVHYSFTGGGGCLSNIGTTTRPGILECNSGTGATGYSAWTTGSQTVDLNSGVWLFQLVVGLQALSTSSIPYVFDAGFTDQAGATPELATNGCYFLYDEQDESGLTSVGSNAWACVCAKSSTRTAYLMNGQTEGAGDGSFVTILQTVGALTLPNTNIYNLKIQQVGSPPTEMDFYVNGTKSCVIETNLPGGASNLTGLGWEIGNGSSTTTTARGFYVDYSLVTEDLNSARSP
jgi:hypothetical protein